MSREQLRATVLRILSEIAPEIDPAQVKPDLNLRDQLDIDSMDFLNFLVALSNELRVEVPEADYGKLATLDACVEYLTSRAPAP
jgi:acyl carrier protein